MSEVTGYFKNVEDLIRENEELKTQNDRLLYQNTMLEQYKSENEGLKEILSLKQRYQEYPTLGANVIAKDISNWYKSFNIDKGLIQGIKEEDVLLSGGAGYIGSHAALSLLDSGHSVHIIDNLSTGNESLIPKNTFFTKCNINDEEVISELIKSNSFDLLMHFAGFIQVEESVKNPQKYFDNNTENATKLFETCKNNGLNKIVFSSTAAAYGSVSENKLIDENTNLNPQNPYAESKIKTENFLFENKHDYKFIILRYFNVAGADKKLRSGQISKRSTHLIKILSEVVVGKRDHIEIFGNDYNTADGTAIRDYIHVSDLADIHLEVAKYLLENSESNLFNCGYGNGFSVLDVINTANKISGDKIDYKFSNRRDGDVEQLIADTSKILKHIDWRPKHNDLSEIINSSIKWEEKINESNT